MHSQHHHSQQQYQYQQQQQQAARGAGILAQAASSESGGWNTNAPTFTPGGSDHLARGPMLVWPRVILWFASRGKGIVCTLDLVITVYYFVVS